MIPQSTIEQIRQASDIVAVVGEYVRLKKKGRAFEAVCPFHVEKTPSFKVNPDKQIYHCFGCGKGGNVFTFLMEHERMSFVEAARHLAQKANIAIRQDKDDAHKEQYDKLGYANQVALDYFQKQLMLPAYSVVYQNYLQKKRQITPETIAFFQIGVTGESWDGLIQYAKDKDLSPEDLVRAGLAIRNEERKSFFDRFRQRLMIPIFSLSQKPIAFGGRTLKKGEPAKYVNSPETPLYSKSNVLYGLNFSRDAIRNSNAAYVVEGYFDFISLWQAGVHNVVASSGTAFTAQQARLLARFCDMVYLFFDADSAGQQAALRSVDVLYDSGLEVKVIQAPEGEDPDSVARKFGRDRIEELAFDSLGYITFRIRQQSGPSRGIIGKEKLIKEFQALGQKIGDPTRRAVFYQEAAGILSIETNMFTNPRSGPAERRSSSPIRDGQVERDFLSLLLCNPGNIDQALENVSPEEFDSKHLARIFQAMIQQYRTRGLLHAQTLIEQVADETAISTITELAAKDWPEDRIDSELASYLLLLRERKRKRIRATLQKELASAEAAGNQTRADEILAELRSYGL